MEADVRTQTRFYRRGMVLGLSMAEIIILIVFVLLLALAATLRYKDKQIADLAHTVQTQEAQIATLVEKINILLPTAGSGNQFDDLFRELRLAKQETDKAKQRVAALEEQAKTTARIVEQLATANIAAASLEQKVAWLNERIQLAEEVRQLLPHASTGNRFDDLLRELRLAKQETDKAKQRVAALEDQAKMTAPLVEQLITATMAKAPLEKKVAWLSECIRLAEEVSRIIQKAGLLPNDPQVTLVEVEKLLASLNGLYTALANGGYESDRIDQFVHQTFMQLHQAEVRNTTLQGQIRNLQQVYRGIGKGTEKPACWASPETGSPEYIFNVALTSIGIIVRDNALPHRREEQEQLPLQTMVFNTEQAPKYFVTASQPLLEWSKAHECRFFVRIFDRTQAHEKGTYKRHLRIVGEQFYYYEAPSGKF